MTFKLTLRNTIHNQAMLRGLVMRIVKSGDDSPPFWLMLELESAPEGIRRRTYIHNEPWSRLWWDTLEKKEPQ